VVKHLIVRGRIDARLLLGVVAVLLGACQGPSEPGSPAATDAETSRAPRPQRQAAAAVKLTRDERIAALRKSLARPLSHSLDGLKIETLPNGRRAVHLDGRFGQVTILRINPDGTRERGCFDNAERAVAFATRNQSQP